MAAVANHHLYELEFHRKLFPLHDGETFFREEIFSQKVLALTTPMQPFQRYVKRKVIENGSEVKLNH
ncbi:MAG: hypothetical protein C0P67_002900 [Bacillota bacterium]|uniref:hypothetical protein n=1 Tax=Planifilum fulgidum TaxID=201973 RepID=UPI000B8852BC|nr:hypothetical protein [Planifilum fulgidum]